MNTPEDRQRRNPFPGLRSFQRSEADRFFGRRQQIIELVDRLDQVQLIAVAGESGCGKSSLVLAGLLDALERPGDNRTVWRAVVMRPGNAPTSELAIKLAELFSGSPSEDGWREASLEGSLRLGGLGLIDAVSTARLPEAVRVLLVVDQFEEVFRFAKSAVDEEAAAFVKLLLNAASEPLSRIHVILTMRTDSLGNCAVYRDLPEAVARGLYLVPRLTREQRTEAIVKPVEARGERIAPSLVQRLLNDVSADFDDLPVMQHVLSRTWQQWARSDVDRPLQLVDYEAAGRADGALSKHADEAYSSLADLQPLAQRVFRALTEKTTEGKTNRRPLRLDSLCRVVAAPREDVAKVIERFRSVDMAFVMPSPPTPLTDDRVIDISHESLIRLWVRLRDEWIPTETTSRNGMSRLLQAARAWEGGSGEPWGRRDIRNADEWLASTKPNRWWIGLGTGLDGEADWELAQRFLGASRWSERIRRAWTLGAPMVMVVILILWGLDGYRLETKARSDYVASQANFQIEQDPALSAQIAAIAVDEHAGNVSAEYALRNAMTEVDGAFARVIRNMGGAIIDARYSADRSILVVAGETQIHLLDPTTLKDARAPINVEGTTQAWLVGGNRWILVRKNDAAELRPLDASAPRLLTCPGTAENTVSTVAVSADHNQLALACRVGQVVMWDLRGTQPMQMEIWSPSASATALTALALSPDAAFVASGDAAGAVRVWHHGDRRAVFDDRMRSGWGKLAHHSQAVRAIAFNPRLPAQLITASDDSQAVFWGWPLAGGRPAFTRPSAVALSHRHEVTMARFVSLQGRNAVLTVSGKDVHLWNSPEFNDRARHNDWAQDADMSDDGLYVATASSDGTAHIYATANMAPVAKLRGHRAAVTHVLFLPATASRHEVLTTSLDNTLRIWSLRPAAQMVTLRRHWELGAAWDPAGGRVAVCGEFDGRRSCEVRDPKDLDADSILLNTPGPGALQFPSWSSDGELVLALKMTNDVYQGTEPVVWNSRTGEDVTPAWLQPKLSVTFSAASPQLATIDRAGVLALWDRRALGQEAPVPKRVWDADLRRTSAALSPNGEWIAGIGLSIAKLWRVSDPKSPALSLEGHQGSIRSLRFSADGRMAVTASEDRTARVWRLPRAGEGNEAISYVELKGGHTGALASATLSHPDGTLVATAGADNTIRVWDARTGDMITTMRVHGDSVNDVQFSSDNKTILSASDDGTVRLTPCIACTSTPAELLRRVKRDLQPAPSDLETLREFRQGPGRWWTRLFGAGQ